MHAVDCRVAWDNARSPSASGFASIASVADNDSRSNATKLAASAQTMATKSAACFSRVDRERGRGGSIATALYWPRLDRS